MNKNKTNMRKLILSIMVFTSVGIMAQSYTAKEVEIFGFNNEVVDTEEHYVQEADITITFDLVNRTIVYRDRKGNVNKDFFIVDSYYDEDNADVAVHFTNDDDVRFIITEDRIAMVYPLEEEGVINIYLMIFNRTN